MAESAPPDTRIEAMVEALLERLDAAEAVAEATERWDQHEKLHRKTQQDPRRLASPAGQGGAGVTIASATALARSFHHHYERLAPRFGYETRPETAVPWEDIPQANRDLMVAVVETMLDRGEIAALIDHRALGRHLTSGQLRAVLEGAEAAGTAEAAWSTLGRVGGGYNVWRIVEEPS